MFFTYQDSNPGNPSDPKRFNGSLPAYIARYLGYPEATTTLRTAAVARCPASLRVLPNVTPNPPLYIPISYFSLSIVTNDPPVGADRVDFPFGRPENPVERPKKHSVIRQPSTTWAMTDCDLQLLLSIGITASTYQDYIARTPVHGAKAPALRNYLYYDWSVRSLKTAK
jgi:hypothetical protein